MDTYIEQSFKNISSDALHSLETRVHIADTIRTTYILKLLGLYKKDSKTVRQLSLAAGPGTRDLHGFHSIPLFKMEKMALQRSNGSSFITFDYKYHPPKSVTLIDNGKEYEELYEQINKDITNEIQAINNDCNIAFKNLEKTNEKNFNVVAGFRIDHRMIPDIKMFFNLLIPILDESSDLILTIGAGHTLEEFIGRKKILRDICTHLKNKGLSPKILALHSEGTHEQERKQPYFGVSPYTTYEILHCNIKKKKLI